MNKASGGDGIPIELFQILKDDAVKVLHPRCQQIWKTQQWPQDWKRTVFISITKKGSAKECSNYHTIPLISHACNVMPQILEFSCFFYDPTNVGHLLSVSLAFSKSRLNIWKFLVHVLLKPRFENLGHYIASM